MKNVVFIVFALVACLAACSSNDAPQIPANKLPVDHTKENLIEYNKQYMEYEDDEINKYIDSLHLQMDKASSGIRYKLNLCSKVKPTPGSKVNITYSVSLLDGTSCPDLTNKTTTVEFGKGKLPVGFEIILGILGKGGSGDFIIPCMLAYGVSGRENCIPPYSPVRCSITLNNIEF